MKVLLFIMLLFLTASGDAAAVRFDFTSGLDGWEEKVFNGQVEYALVFQEGRQVLQADSKGRASALIRWVNIDPKQSLKLRWRWKINQTLEKGHAGQKTGDDYPARIYIVFDSWLPNFARSLNYIWASRQHSERIITSAYTKPWILLP